ncbi:porin [Paraburkholderia susongensis]|uniref:Outer membrane protein (Porin) n=1 Tax=Paraburkholderia susongensis TaxID=1515439 RepID=A0A1X7LPL6_9BURK|nr:porin [Paraburkholderia susongensis]SMG55192.1 Outer membrane protein (porin) [Paraburkholderia susongensis]
MKKVIGAIGLALVASTACAQSTVTLAGVVGGGLRWQNGTAGGSKLAFAANDIALSAFILQGKEDLGGGTEVTFYLRNTFDPGTGGVFNPAVLFSSTATIGLSTQYGQLTFGRQFSAFEDFYIQMDPSSARGSAPTVPGAFLVGNYFTGDDWFNNTVKYRVQIGGLVFRTSYSFGGVAGNTRAGSNYSASAVYQGGIFSGGAAYGRTYNADASQWAQTAQIGGTAQLGPVRLYANYLSLAVTGASATSPQRRSKIPTVGLVYMPTPAVALTAAFYNDVASNLGNVAGASGRKATSYAIAEYFLSKRTELYAEVDRNGFSGAYKTDPANVLTFNLRPGASASTGVAAGMVTRF